jgi:hypothetical protein
MSRLSHLLDTRLIDGGEVATLMRRPPFTPGIFLVLISVGGRVDPRAILQLEGQLINPMTSGIEPAIFQRVV